MVGIIIYMVNGCVQRGHLLFKWRFKPPASGVSREPKAPAPGRMGAPQMAKKPRHLPSYLREITCCAVGLSHHVVCALARSRQQENSL